MKMIKEQLKKVRDVKGLINPDSSWVSENKNKLMSQIGSIVQNETRSTNMVYKFESFQKLYTLFIPKGLSRSFKPVLVTFMAIVITAGGWVASAYAEPGDTLWGAKLAWNSIVEKGQLVITPDEDETSLHLEFATKRAKVLKQVVDRQDVEPIKKARLVKQAADDLEDKLNNADESLRNTSPDKAAALMKDVSLKTKEISKTLKETAQKIEIEDEGSELAKDINKQAIDSKKKSLGMIEVVVQKKAEAQIEISEEEKIIIKNHIDGVVNDLREEAAKAQSQAEGLVGEVDDAREVGSEIVVSSTINRVEIEGKTVVSSSDNILLGDVESGILDEDEMKTVSTTIIETVDPEEKAKDMVERTEQIVQVADEKGDEVESLVDEDILGAIHKVQELQDVVSKTTKEMEETVEEILPQINNSGIRHNDENTSVNKDEEIAQ